MTLSPTQPWKTQRHSPSTPGVDGNWVARARMMPTLTQQHMTTPWAQTPPPTRARSDGHKRMKEIGEEWESHLPLLVP